MARRSTYSLLAVLSFGLCLLIATQLRNLPFIRGFLGDWLVIILLYFLAQGFLAQGFLAQGVKPLEPRLLAGGVFLLGCLIEGLQFLRMADRLGLQGWLRIVLGATFDPLDLAAYFLGSLTAYGVDVRLVRRGERR